MRLLFTDERVIAVVAHPDDAELLCAGTLARARQDGAVIALCVLCRGDKGQPDPPIKNLGEVRRREMGAAAKLLGAKLFTCGYSDGSLVDSPSPRRKVMEVFRRFKPTLVLGHFPYDYHPDHCAAACITEAATWFCASHGHETASPPLPSPPALWQMDTVEMIGFEPGFFVDITEQMPLKLQMLACHRSQLSRGADLPALTDLVQRQAGARGAQANVRYAEAFRLAPLMRRRHAW